MAENGFKCDYCDQKLQGYKKLRLHIKSEHSDRSVTFTCSVCAKVFLSGSKLRSHITKRHEGAEMPWKCSLCNKSYQHHSSLKYHARFAHPDQVGDLENGNSDQSQFTGGDTDKVEN